jgi:tetratricopeptide (TPR) repeat protein
MSGHRHLSRFWVELKRRNVLRSLAVYAGSAFIILEAATIIFPRWGFPDWSIDLVLYLLIFGALVNLVISWFFDITSTGVQKTKPLEEEVTGPPALPASRSWKAATYISLVVIVALIVWNVVPGKGNGSNSRIDSLVILPFDNFTGDDQMETMIAGMHSMLIGDIGRINGLRVISPTTSRIFKKGDKSIPEIASDLGVNAVIEPSVMCFGDTVCMQVKVMSTYPEEKMLWVADYREPKSEVLNLYNRITQELAEKVRIELTEGEKEILTENRTVQPDALDAYLKAQYYWELLNMDSIPKALANFQLAAELDPDWADPYAGLGLIWSMFRFFGALPASSTQPMVDQYLARGMELNPNSSVVHFVEAIDAVWGKMEWEHGEAAFLKSIELNPNDALTRLYYAHLLMILRRNEEAMQMAEIGLRLDPMKPLVLGLYGVVMTGVKRYPEAIRACEKAVSIDPGFRFAHSNILFPAYEMGDYEKWLQAWMDKVVWSDGAKASVQAAFDKGGHLEAVREMFRLNEMYFPGDCFMSDGVKAERYMYLGEKEKALDHFEKVIENSPLDGPYLGTNLCFYDQLKDQPRYIALLEKLNLPLPEE